jgi:four helix bundle protein
MRDFTKMRVWHHAADLAPVVYSLTQQFPDAERFGITSQLRRAAVSVSTNIAEGAGRDSRKEQRRFLSMAIGSTNELHSLLVVAGRLGLSSRERCDDAIDHVVEMRKRLIAFRATIH